MQQPTSTLAAPAKFPERVVILAQLDPDELEAEQATETILWINFQAPQNAACLALETRIESEVGLGGCALLRPTGRPETIARLEPGGVSKWHSDVWILALEPGRHRVGCVHHKWTYEVHGRLHGGRAKSYLYVKVKDRERQ